MNRIKVVMLLSVFLLSSVGVSATVKNVEYGGHWDYGNGTQGNLSKKVWSNLMSSIKAHGTSTAIGEKAHSSKKQQKERCQKVL